MSDANEPTEPLFWEQIGVAISTVVAIAGVAVSFLWSVGIGIGLFAVAGAVYWVLDRRLKGRSLLRRAKRDKS